jgi:heme oxygenase (biliverdin-IX-beta and delta-forming)
MSSGHQLPPEPAGGQSSGHSGGQPRTPGAVAQAAPEPTHAERARTLVAGSNRGVLSTVALDPPGYPFGSIATYALDRAGRPVVFVSTMAEHTRNAGADPRASLIVVEPAAGVVGGTGDPASSDPLAAGRVTLIGDLLEVGPGERPAVRGRYLEANPASAYYIDFGDFSFWRLEVRRVRYVGGYGRMSWVGAADYAGAAPDPLAGQPAAGIIEHMNADHTDALVLVARVFGGRPQTTSAVLTAVDRYGFDLVAQGPDGRGALRLGFTAPVAEPGEVRREFIRLVHKAREIATSS